MTYCDICQSEQDERAIQYAEVMQTVTVKPDWSDTYGKSSSNPDVYSMSHSIAVCSDCIATHSDEELTELLITIAEEN